MLPLGVATAQQAPSAENPVVLYKGLGVWHHPIHTASAEAQKFFDQGLALTYGFNRYEALRSFRKASELDPQAAMPCWGIAMGQGPYTNLRRALRQQSLGGGIRAPCLSTAPAGRLRSGVAYVSDVAMASPPEGIRGK